VLEVDAITTTINVKYIIVCDHVSSA